MAQLGGLDDVALRDFLQPVGNVVVYRTFPLTIGITAIETAVPPVRPTAVSFPLTIGITAIETAVGLTGGCLGLEWCINLSELMHPDARFPLLRVLACNVDKLEIIVAHTAGHSGISPAVRHAGRR